MALRLPFPLLLPDHCLWPLVGDEMYWLTPMYLEVQCMFEDKKYLLSCYIVNLSQLHNLRLCNDQNSRFRFQYIFGFMLHSTAMVIFRWVVYGWSNQCILVFQDSAM